LQLNSTSASISITWDAVPDVSYLLYYKNKETDNWYSFETWINFAILFNLDVCQTYEWKVAVKCNEENISAHSDVLQFTTSGCRLDKDENKRWQVYPNPVKNILRVNIYNLYLDYENVKFEIYDISGKLHLRKKILIDKHQESILLNVASLPQGFYYFNLSSGGIHHTKKIQIHTN